MLMSAHVARTSPGASGRVVDHGALAGQLLDGLQQRAQGDRVIAAQVDHLEAQRPERGQRAAHDVVDVGEIALLPAVAVEHDRPSFLHPLDEAEDAHLRPAGRAVDREVAQNGDIQSMQRMEAVAQQLRRALGGGVGRERAADIGVFTEGACVVRAVQTGGRGLHELRDGVRAAQLEQMERAQHIRAGIKLGEANAGAHAGAGGEVDHRLEWAKPGQGRQCLGVRDVEALKVE